MSDLYPYFPGCTIAGYNSFRTHASYYHPIKGHTGQDFGCVEGTQISLPISTVCVNSLFLSEMGNTLFLRDPEGNILIFAHLSQIFANVGSTIEAGEVFCRTGNTGSVTTGPHLHFEIIAQTEEPGNEVCTRDLGGFSGWNINPIPYLDKIFAPKGPEWYQEAMDWAVRHQIFTEFGDPSAPVDRAVLATSLMRLTARIKEWSKNDWQ